MDAYVRNVIKLHGIRNVLLAFIPPTETISLFAKDVISGISPSLLMLTHTNFYKMMALKSEKK